MSNVWKRSLSLLLVIVMIAGMMPVNAMALDLGGAAAVETGVVESEAVPAAEGDSDLAVSEDNFPDANFRSYVSNNIDTNGDDLLSEAEIAAVTEIDCSTAASPACAAWRYLKTCRPFGATETI